jgi:hypothetical protein
MSEGITLSGDQVDIIAKAVTLLIETARDQKPSGQRKMALKQQRAIFAAATEIAGELEDAASMRRKLQMWIRDPKGMIDISQIWGDQYE